jgi:hypothetical protein
VPAVAVDLLSRVRLEVTGPPAELFVDLAKERVLGTLTGIDMAAEQRPASGADDARLVVAMLEQKPAIVGDDQADGDLREAVVCDGASSWWLLEEA